MTGGYSGRHKWPAALLSLVLLAGGLASGVACQAAAQVLATYGADGQSVTAEELATWYRFQPRQADILPSLAIQNLILTRTLAAEAVASGLAQQPAIQFRLRLAEADLAKPILRKQLYASIQLSAQQIEAQYLAIQGDYVRPRRVRLYNIYKRYPPAATAADKTALRQQMQDLRKRLLAGADFKQLAAAESDSQTRWRQGLIGNVAAGTLRPQIDRVAMQLQPGEISDILSTAEGLTILYCEQVLEAVVRSPQELRQAAEQTLKSQIFEQRWQQLQTDWLTRSAARYHWQALADYPQQQDAVILDYAHGTLTVAQLAWLMSAGSARGESLTRLPQASLRAAMEAFLSRTMSRHELAEQQLDQSPEFLNQRDWTRQQLLAQQLLMRWVQQRLVRPDEAAIEQYYQANKASFQRPAQYDLAAIMVPLVQDDIRQTYRQCEWIVHQLATGQLDFATAARRYSKHPSASRGGQLGWISRTALPRRLGLDVLRAVLQMKPGEISDLVHSEQDVLWILQLRGVQEKRLMNYAEARALAENRLGNARVQALEAEITGQWLAQLQIQFPTPASSAGATAPAPPLN